MRVTLEGTDPQVPTPIVTIENKHAETMEDLADLFRSAAIGFGFHPNNVHEFINTEWYPRDVPQPKPTEPLSGEIPDNAAGIPSIRSSASPFAP
jgi:hypothetical protein